MVNKFLDVVEDEIKLQSEVYIVVIAQIENSKSKIENRIMPSRLFSFALMNITNFDMISSLISSIVRANNRKPSKSNTHDSE